LLSDIGSLELPAPATDYAENIYWVFGLVLKEEYPPDRDAIRESLNQCQIGTRPFFWPMHQQPVFEKMGLFSDQSHPVAERIARRGFYIPSGLSLTDRKMDKVSQAIHAVLQ
ncbi:MAG: DegT/DnrJ/EryC1/StrS family aminotransferase, partial [Desulfobacterales bacterium]